MEVSGESVVEVFDESVVEVFDDESVVGVVLGIECLGFSVPVFPEFLPSTDESYLKNDQASRCHFLIVCYCVLHYFSQLEVVFLFLSHEQNDRILKNILLSEGNQNTFLDESPCI